MSLLLCQLLLLHYARLECGVPCTTQVRNILTLFMNNAHYVLCCSNVGLMGCLLLLAVLPQGGGGRRVKGRVGGAKLAAFLL